MQSSELKTGKRYALRLRSKDREEAIHQVELVAVVGRGGKIKVRHSDGELAGLEEFVTTRQLLCPWRELRALLEGGRTEVVIPQQPQPTRTPV